MSPGGVGSSTPDGEASAPWTLGEALDVGWAGVRAHPGPLVGAQIVSAIPAAVAGQVIRAWIDPAHPFSREGLTVMAIDSSVAFLLSRLFAGGLVAMQCSAARGETPAFAQLVRGARFFLPLLVLGLIDVTALALVPLLVVPYVWVALGLAFAPYLVVDRGMSVGAALRESFRLARGQRVPLFFFFVIAAIVAYLGLFACCVGGFVTGPLVGVATAFVYTRFRPRPEAPQEGLPPYFGPYQPP